MSSRRAPSTPLPLPLRWHPAHTWLKCRLHPDPPAAVPHPSPPCLSQGIEHVLSFTACAGKVLVRHYLARLLKSAEGTSPHVHLQEMGPSLDLAIRRKHQPAPDMMKAAMARPKATAEAPKKVKNVSRSKLFGKQGKLHMPRQDLSQMATARMKALGKSKGPRKQKVGADDADSGGAKRQRTS